MDNENVIYTMEFYSMGKNKIINFQEKMDASEKYYSEVTQVQKGEYCILSHI